MKLRSRPVLLATLLGCLLAAPAAAEVQAFTVWQELSLRFTDLGAAAASATATGVATIHTSSTASNHLSTLSLPAQSLVTSIPVTDPNQAPITEVRFDLQRSAGAIGNISGAIASEEGGLTPGTLPMTGGARICIFVQWPNCVASLTLPLGATSGGVPAGVGVGGLLTVGGTGTIRVSILGAAYTVSTVSAVARTANGGLEVHTARGFAHGPASATSSTAQTSGVLQIVTASHITVVGPGDQDLSGTLSHTLVHIIAVPEPGLLLLFLSGAGLLALLGARRRRGG